MIIIISTVTSLAGVIVIIIALIIFLCRRRLRRNRARVETTTNWELSREQVEIVKVIGSGAFGQVAKGEVRNINGIKGQTLTVAIKMPKENASASDREVLLSELYLMKNPKPHPHVIKLMGCLTETDPLLVLIE